MCFEMVSCYHLDAWRNKLLACLDSYLNYVSIQAISLERPICDCHVNLDSLSLRHEILLE